MDVVYYFLLIAVALMFGGFLCLRSEAVNPYKIKYFLFALGINIIELLSEAIGYCPPISHNYIVLYVANVVSFILAPLLPYCLTLMNRPGWRTHEKLMIIPAVFNGVMTLVSLNTHWYFYVDASNSYRRGPFFLLSLMITVGYLVFLGYDTLKTYEDSDGTERIFLGGLVLFSMTGIIVQMLVPSIASVTPTVALVLLLYYIFIIELNGKYDSLTSVRNRSAFEKRKPLLTESREYTLVVIDLNGLKITNDLSGHEEGDHLIMDAAKILVTSFSGIGTVFRIGGDEFCIICENETSFVVSAALTRVEKNMVRLNRQRDIPLNMAYGVGENRVENPKDFSQVFKIADEAMYNMKKEFYKMHTEYDRRANRR